MAEKPDSNFEALKANMLSLLPEDGTPVLNRVMRVTLARKLGRAVDEETYFKARDALLENGLVGRLRGQGGQIFLAKENKQSPTPAALERPIDAWTEAKLMGPLQAFLEGPFRKNLDLPNGSACIIQDTSLMGGHKGKWARPDFILAACRTQTFGSV